MTNINSFIFSINVFSTQSNSLRFNKNEEELWEHLNKQENKAKYLKSLIAEDMGYKNFSHFHGITPTFAQTERWNDQKDNNLKSYNEKRRWSLKHLIDYIDENDIDDNEWEQIKQLFICEDDNITKVYCEAGFNGALPFEAWTPQLIKDKLNDLFIELAIPNSVDVNNIPEEQLKSYLIECWLFDPNSKLEKHINFYRIDAQQFLDDFNIDIDITERYRKLTSFSPENPNSTKPFKYPRIPKNFKMYTLIKMYFYRKLTSRLSIQSSKILILGLKKKEYLFTSYGK